MVRKYSLRILVLSLFPLNFNLDKIGMGSVGDDLYYFQGPTVLLHQTIIQHLALEEFHVIIVITQLLTTHGLWIKRQRNKELAPTLESSPFGDEQVKKLNMKIPQVPKQVSRRRRLELNMPW
ncbi:uncharacterized protein LOC143887490 [Tasmannia lanceolata]|uniref:uncharacterized protein LOC143887490 n=1 Tax=Tasmannia lanceolata TaxID=3420 RepID=UPI004063679D